MNKYSFEELKDDVSWKGFLQQLPLSENGFPRYSFIQSIEWANFQSKLGRKSILVGVKSDGKLVGLFAGIIINAKRGRYLYIRNGPVIDWSNKPLINETLGYIKDFCKKNGLWFARMSPLVDKNSVESSNIKGLGLMNFEMNDVEALDTWLMDITGTEEEVFNRISKKTRYEIRSVEKETEILITKDVKYVDEFYKIEEDTVKRNGWTAYSKEYIKAEFESFAEKGEASIILVSYQGKFIAGGIFIHYIDSTYYHYGASLTEFRHIPGTYRVIWEAIKVAKSMNHRLFNFWGITPENAKESHPWTGLTRFKMKFPGQIQRWNEAKDIPVSYKYYLTKLFERYDKLRKGY